MIVRLRKVMAEDVLEAYRQTKMKPVAKCYGVGRRGCALSALYHAETGNEIGGHVFEHFTAKLGGDYTAGFVNGFDFAAVHKLLRTEEYDEGYRDGEAVRKAVEEEFGSLGEE